MAENTKIEWAHHTFNPWIGCTRVGPGCDHCYAADLSKARLGVEWGPGAPRRRTAATTWKQPRRWNNRAAKLGIRYRVFCASLADVFDNEVDPAWRADLFALIRETPHLDWLLVTKRIGNAEQMAAAAGGWPENVWLGATIVNQAEADRDIPKLLTVKGPRYVFLSMEPLLGPIDLTALTLTTCTDKFDALEGMGWGVNPERYGGGRLYNGAAKFPYRKLDWVIVGGESGHHARPMHPDWARSLRDQCAAAGVPFLFKQWGEWAPREWKADGGTHAMNSLRPISFQKLGHHPNSLERTSADPEWQAFAKAGKKAAGRLLDGVQHDGVPA